MRVSDHFDQLVLQFVCILELIYHDILELLLQLLQQMVVIKQHFIGNQQHIIKVHFVMIQFPLLIAG
ncbi:hypothetical protein D3C76_1669790 [compost metagenome]